MGSHDAAIRLYDYQKRWLADHARFKIGMFARQTGKTFSTTLEIIGDCLDAEAKGKRTHWVILSRGERQAREAMETCKRHLEAHQAGFQALEYEFNPDIHALEIRFPSGSRITALPANPDTARGFSANVFLDEFAFHKDSHAIWRALYPVVAAGYKIRVVSTPNGKGNRFYELMTDASLDQVWSRHTLDIYHAVEQGLPRDVDELRIGMADPDGWEQEFELHWMDAAHAWLDYDLINRCEHVAAGIPEHYQGQPVFVGVDIAARNDLFAIWVIEAVGDVYWTREVIVRRKCSFAEQDALLDGVFQRYRVSRGAMDQTGMGEKPVEDAKRRHGDLRIEGMLFSGARKLDMATGLKQLMQDQRLRIPAGDPLMRADLHAVSKVVGATGIPRLVADTDTDGHADRFWSLALAVSAADTPAVTLEYQSTGPRPSTTMLAPSNRGFGGVSAGHDYRGF